VSKRRYTDLGLYRRLVTYLHGTKWVVAGLVLAMLFEALFTVTTLSLTRPALELLIKNRLTDVTKAAEKASFELAPPQPVGEETYALRAAGELAGSRAAEELHGALAALLKPPHKWVILDLSQVHRIDESGWAQCYFGRMVSAQRGVKLTIILPQGETNLHGLDPHEWFEIYPEGAPPAVALLTTKLKDVPVPVLTKKHHTGWISSLKAEFTKRTLPYLERLQDYVMTSSENKFRLLGLILGAMVVSALCMVTAAFFAGYLSAYLGNLCLLRLRNHVYRHMLTLDMEYYNRRAVGTLLSTIMQDVMAISGAIEVLFSNVLKTPLTVVTLIIAMLFISPPLTLLSFGVAPILGLLLYGIGRKVRKISKRVQEIRAQIASIAEETFSGIRVVKAYNMETKEANRYERESWNVFGRTLKTVIAEELGTGLVALLGIVTVSAMILAGGYYVLQTRELSGSDFVLFILFLTQVFRPLKGSSRVIAKIQRGMAGSDRVFRVLDTKAKIVDDPSAPELRPVQREISFEHVWFRYSAESHHVLKDVHFTVPAGHVTAIVGETGAGKTTLVNLLPRFYDPTEGRILFDGVDIRSVRLRSLRDQIAIITQDVILFNDTIARNIAYGMPDDIPRERIIEAAKAANAHNFIMRLPHGYDTVVGGRGVRLSGGERQRLAIARAFVKNAPILILDEATSQLDSETEALIQEALSRIIKGRTVFVIAHRLSTILHADSILVLDQGKIVERGTHDELVKLGGRYARFYEIQFRQALAAANSKGENSAE